MQTVTFTAAANAASQSGDPELSAPESSVTEAVYGDPEGALIMPLAAGPTDKTALIMEKNTPFPLEVREYLIENNGISNR
ncbi:hypothetical protein [Paenibacillus lautus]|uniref:hypothetical protein n=1 Tax=Paenibacillus lautus TaxID=1401 RepID=UPI003D2C4DF1